MASETVRIFHQTLIIRAVSLFKTQYVQEHVEGLRRAFQGRFRAIERKY